MLDKKRSRTHLPTNEFGANTTTCSAFSIAESGRTQVVNCCADNSRSKWARQWDQKLDMTGVFRRSHRYEKGRIEQPESIGYFSALRVKTLDLSTGNSVSTERLKVRNFHNENGKVNPSCVLMCTTPPQVRR
jgi:hypothetical protein